MSDREPHPSERPPNLLHAWTRRLGYALRGVVVAVVGESNFWVYGAATVAVIAVGVWVELSVERWCVLALAVTVIFVAEMFNTSIEQLARAITRERRPELRDALDVASAAVLVAAIGAAIVGVAALGPPLVAALRA
jgi:diacylglycerol kinase (ATP)